MANGHTAGVDIAQWWADSSLLLLKLAKRTFWWLFAAHLIFAAWIAYAYYFNGPLPFSLSYGVAALVGLTALIVLSAWCRERLAAGQQSRELGTASKLLVLALLLIVLIVVSLVSGGAIDQRIGLLRWLLWGLLTSLPALLYILFIANRRFSVLNEYIENLYRLGLLNRSSDDRSEGHFHRRIRGYLDRFQSAYGPLPRQTMDRQIDGVLNDEQKRDTGGERSDLLGLVNMGTPFSVILTTLLIGVFMTATLPPWELTTLPRVVDPVIARSVPPSQTAGTTENRFYEGLSRFLGFSAGARGRQAAGAQPTDPAANPAAPSDTVDEVAPKPATGAADGAGANYSDILREAKDTLRAVGAYENAPAMAESKPNVNADGAQTEARRLRSLKQQAAFDPIRSPVFFAFLGAYFFCLQSLFRRYAFKDLRPANYDAVSVRIVIAVVGVWAVVEAYDTLVSMFAGTADEPQSPQKAGDDRLLLDNTVTPYLILAFFVGAFPKIVLQFLGSAVRRFPMMGRIMPSLETKMPLSDLDGLTIWHEARLEEEDIEEVPNVATTDVVDLMLRTRIPAYRIIDWVDQAILYTAIGSEPGKKGASGSKTSAATPAAGARSELNDSNDDVDEAAAVPAKPAEPDAPQMSAPPVATIRQRLRRHGIRSASGLLLAHYRASQRNELEAFFAILGKDSGGRPYLRTIVDTLTAYDNLRLVLTWKGLKVCLDSSPCAPIAGK